MADYLAGTVFTIFVVPVAYYWLAHYTGSPSDVRRRLEAEMQQEAQHR